MILKRTNSLNLLLITRNILINAKFKIIDHIKILLQENKKKSKIKLLFTKVDRNLLKKIDIPEQDVLNLFLNNIDNIDIQIEEINKKIEAIIFLI